jgi:hypothetical protein
VTERSAGFGISGFVLRIDSELAKLDEVVLEVGAD